MPSISRPMSKVDGWAIRILAADAQGLNPCYVQEAMDHLGGKPLPPLMDMALCREAAAINHRISCDENTVSDANDSVAELMAKYSLYEQPSFSMQQPAWSGA